MSGLWVQLVLGSPESRMPSWQYSVLAGSAADAVASAEARCAFVGSLWPMTGLAMEDRSQRVFERAGHDQGPGALRQPGMLRTHDLSGRYWDSVSGSLGLSLVSRTDGLAGGCGRCRSAA